MANHPEELETSGHSDPLQTSVSAIEAWLDRAPSFDVGEGPISLDVHLDRIRESNVLPPQRVQILSRLVSRCISTVDALRPSLMELTLPVPRRTRRLMRVLQAILRTLAEDLLAALNEIGGPLQAIALWSSHCALARHLLLGNLMASPAGRGVWHKLHQTWGLARMLDICDFKPDGAAATLRSVHYSAILLGCAQPASFSSREVDLAAHCADHFAGLLRSSDDRPADPAAVFWVDPTRDLPATALARKAVPPGARVEYFDCGQLAAALDESIVALDARTGAGWPGLPDFAATPVGIGVLRRLVVHWGDPGKRRFPRRRQSYRAVLCAGVERLWHLFRDGGEPAEQSDWMITNECPDGYAVMHVSGKTGALAVGDIAAIRTETGDDWQVCIVRWAQSESREHLELGLQILASGAVPALFAPPAGHHSRHPLPVLILPELKALGLAEMLVVPAGVLDQDTSPIVLVLEQENIEVREMRSTGVGEQNSRIGIFSIESATPSA